jgi:hypothetical protein
MSRAHREELKRLWFSLDRTNIPEKKEIIVDLRYVKSKFWPGYGYVQILSDGPNGYSSFSTHQEHPLKYAKNKMKEEKYKEYKLVIK